MEQIFDICPSFCVTWLGRFFFGRFFWWRRIPFSAGSSSWIRRLRGLCVSNDSITSCCVLWLFSAAASASWDAGDDLAEMLHVEGRWSVGSYSICGIRRHVSWDGNSVVWMVVLHDKKLVHHYLEEALKSTEYTSLMVVKHSNASTWNFVMWPAAKTSNVFIRYVDRWTCPIDGLLSY